MVPHRGDGLVGNERLEQQDRETAGHRSREVLDPSDVCDREPHRGDLALPLTEAAVAGKSPPTRQETRVGVLRTLGAPRRPGGEVDPGDRLRIARRTVHGSGFGRLLTDLDHLRGRAGLRDGTGHLGEVEPRPHARHQEEVRSRRLERHGDLSIAVQRDDRSLHGPQSAQGEHDQHRADPRRQLPATRSPSPIPWTERAPATRDTFSANWPYVSERSWSSSRKSASGVAATRRSSRSAYVGASISQGHSPEAVMW